MEAIKKGTEEAIEAIIGRALIDYSATYNACEIIEAARKEILGVLGMADRDGNPLSLFEKFYFSEEKFGFNLSSGTKSTLLHFMGRVEGEPSDVEHRDEVLIWIPTKALSIVRDALYGALPPKESTSAGKGEENVGRDYTL